MLQKIYEIGKELSSNQEQIDKYVKKIKKIESTEENPKIQYIVKMIIDLCNKKIEFDLEKKYEETDTKKYNFLETPKGNSKNYPLVWGGKDKSLHNLTGSAFHSFKLQLQDEKEKIMQETYTKLDDIINKIIINDLYDKREDDQRKDSKFNCSYLHIPEIHHNKIMETVINLKKKKDIVDSQQNPVEAFKEYIYTNNKIESEYIKKYLLQGAGAKDIVFYFPVVKFETEEIELTKMPEYREFYLATKSKIKLPKEKNNKFEYCYVCNEKKAQQKTPSFDRGSISQVFVTTTINSASELKKKAYYKNLSICEECQNFIKTGETFIKDNLRFTIAGTPTYLLPYFYNVKSNFDYEAIINEIKTDTELLFKSNDIKNFIKEINYELEDVEKKHTYWLNNIFSLTFLSYQSDGNSFKILNIIDDVSKTRFEKIITIFDKEYEKILPYGIKKFSINSIYKLIPVKKDSKGKNQALEFFNGLFKLNIFIRKNLIGHFTTSMKYLYYLTPAKFKSSSDIYPNLMKSEKFDFTIKEFVFRYLVIINALRKLNILEKEDLLMDGSLLGIKEEEFLNKQKFGEQERALFFLGLILKLVGNEQRSKKHYTIPILQKIQFQGMTYKDIQRLYLDLIEKTRQYNNILKFNHQDVSNYMKAFHNYFDKHLHDWRLSDEENVFYLLSGYAYKTSEIIESASADTNNGGAENEK